MRVHDRDSVTIGCNVHDRYILEEMIGEGAYGAVWAARERMNSGHSDESRYGRQVAVKKLPYGEDIHREVMVLKTVDHPSVARLYEVFDDGKNMYMVLEKCEGGELLDRMLSTQDHFDENTTKQIMHQLTSALMYCHRRNIIHRDIKPENILFCTSDSDSATWVKLVDFGLALGSTDDTPRLRTGTEIYSAPELHANTVPQITSKADMWALGCVLFSMISGQVPFAGANAHIALQRGTFSLHMEGGTWDSISLDCKDAIRGLLLPDPVDRWSAEELLTSSWLFGCHPPLPLGPHALSPADTSLAEHMTHLCSFAEQGLFRRICLCVVARHMDWTHSGRFVEAFYRLDVDGDGMISRNDWQQVWGSVMCDEKYTKEDAELVFQALNISASGGIEFSEYLAACVDQQVLAEESLLWSTFSYFGGTPDGSLKFSNLQSSIKHAIGSDSQVDLVVSGEDYLSMGADISIEFGDFKTMLREGIVSADVSPFPPTDARCVRWNDDIDMRSPAIDDECNSTAASSSERDHSETTCIEELIQMAASPMGRCSRTSHTSNPLSLGLPLGGLRRTGLGLRGIPSPTSGRIGELGIVTRRGTAATSGRIGDLTELRIGDPSCGTSPVTVRNGRCAATRKSSAFSTMSGRVGDRMPTKQAQPFALGLPINSRAESHHTDELMEVGSSSSMRSDQPLSLGLPGVRSLASRPRDDVPSVSSAGGVSTASQPLSLGLPMSSLNRTTSKTSMEVSTVASSSTFKSRAGAATEALLPIAARTAALTGNALAHSFPSYVPSTEPNSSAGDSERQDASDDDVLSPLGVQAMRCARYTRSPTQDTLSRKTLRLTQVSGKGAVSSVCLQRIRARSIMPPEGESAYDMPLSFVAHDDNREEPAWRTVNYRATMAVGGARAKFSAVKANIGGIARTKVFVA